MKESDNYQTDKWLKDMFEDWYDPCPFRTVDSPNWENGLMTEWGKRAFVNPPFSDMPTWVDKAILENQKGCLVVMICKHDSSTAWFRRLHEAGAQVMFFHGRLKYRTGKAPAWPSCMVVLGCN